VAAGRLVSEGITAEAAAAFMDVPLPVVTGPDGLIRVPCPRGASAWGMCGGLYSDRQAAGCDNEVDVAGHAVWTAREPPTSAGSACVHEAGPVHAAASLHGSSGGSLVGYPTRPLADWAAGTLVTLCEQLRAGAAPQTLARPAMACLEEDTTPWDTAVATAAALLALRSDGRLSAIDFNPAEAETTPGRAAAGVLLSLLGGVRGLLALCGVRFTVGTVPMPLPDAALLLDAFNRRHDSEARPAVTGTNAHDSEARPAVKGTNAFDAPGPGPGRPGDATAVAAAAAAGRGSQIYSVACLPESSPAGTVAASEDDSTAAAAPRRDSGAGAGAANRHPRPPVRQKPPSPLTVGARALAKHAHRASDGWWGACTGSEAAKNAWAQAAVLRILRGAVWVNTHLLPHSEAVVEVRVVEGYGARWALPLAPAHASSRTMAAAPPGRLSPPPASDGGLGAPCPSATGRPVHAVAFRGFLEPVMPGGHAQGWRH
jgi:hypothetical protein